jgi:molecular chaperone HtpG
VVTEPTTDSGSPRPFQVDLRGVVDLLSRHIYSGPRVYLRELLQNARDAITARAELDGGDPGRRVRIEPLGTGAEPDVFVLRDDGVGLTADEVAELLSTVGRSSKRDILDLPRSDYLGQFGIGLLSCFMVADRIVIRSRSARGGDAVEWRGDAAGTFTVRTLDEELPIGTSVHLAPRPDQADLLGVDAVLRLAVDFGEFLPVAIEVTVPDGEPVEITRPPAFLPGPGGITPENLDYGTALLGAAPLDAIPLEVPATGTRGTAYVLAQSPSPGARQATRVYLGRMLVAERLDGLLPDWAFFVRVVLDSTELHPTASREDLVDDDALALTRDAVGAAIRRWVLELGVGSPQRPAAFVAVHQLALKSLVLHDEELARFITRWLAVETTLGALTIDALLREHRELRYTETVDEFRQAAAFAQPDRPIVNGGYTYDAEIVRMLPRLVDDVRVERVDILAELDALASPPLADRDLTSALEDRASAVLAVREVEVVVRTIGDTGIPALYVADPRLLRDADRESARRASGALWGGVLANAGRDGSEGSAHARLCLNWNDRVVRMLATLGDDAVFARTVQVLYGQALLVGHRPLQPGDRELLTGALTDLMALSVGLDAGLPEEGPR